MNLENFLILSGALFTIGLYGAVTKRSLVTVLMCIELMFNGVNIAAVAFSRYIVPKALADNPATTSDDVVQFLLSGQVFAIFIITVAAAEVALGLAIVIAIYRNLETVDIGRVSEMKY